jgi:hypothetical protein
MTELEPETDAPPEEPSSADKPFPEIWAEHVIKSKNLPLIVITAAFQLTFIIVRVITHGIRDGWLPFGNLEPGGTHIHHYVWGIGIVLVVGYVELAFHPTRLRSVLGMLYGIGAALIVDEFALLLNLKDVYWASQGRESIDAAIIVSGLLLLAVLLRPFLHAAAHELRRR